MYHPSEGGCLAHLTCLLACLAMTRSLSLEGGREYVTDLSEAIRKGSLGRREERRRDGRETGCLTQDGGQRRGTALSALAHTGHECRAENCSSRRCDSFAHHPPNPPNSRPRNTAPCAATNPRSSPLWSLAEVGGRKDWPGENRWNGCGLREASFHPALARRRLIPRSVYRAYAWRKSAICLCPAVAR